MGIGQQVAVDIFKQFTGTWEVMQMFVNKPAILFWEKVIAEYTHGNFSKSEKEFPEPKPHNNLVLRFKA